MKRVISIVIIALFVLYSLLPLGIWVTGLTGYSFSLRNYAASAVGSAIISIMGSILVCMDKGGEAALPGRMLSLFLLPVSLADWVCYILLSPWKPTVFCMVVCSACALTYMLKYTQRKMAKIIMSVICIVILIPVCFLSFLNFLFSGFGSSTVVQTIASPDGSYKVEVISNDQGALGGDTYVNLIDVQSEIDLYILQITQKPRNVYSGDWDDWRDMEIYWEDDRTLWIDGERFLAD